jgi:hypothetical protein
LSGWEWANVPISFKVAARIIGKVLIVLVAINLIWAAFDPLPLLDRATIYGGLVPARPRFAFSQPPDIRAATVIRLDAMFNAHEIALPITEPARFYRVAILGGSATWGFGLNWDKSLSSCINARAATLNDGRIIYAFNLAYPVPSVTRDLLILRRALGYHIDDVVWFVSGIGLFRKRLIVPSTIITANPTDLYAVLDRYPIQLDPLQIPPRQSSFLDRTMIGERAYIATWTQDQLFALPWAQTRIDFAAFSPDIHYNPKNIDADESWFDLDRKYSADQVDDNSFMFETLDVGAQLAQAAHVRLMFAIDPMWSATRQESALRYNTYFPRWYFDRLDKALVEQAAARGWNLWQSQDSLPRTVFTDSPFHYDPVGACLLADQVIARIQAQFAAS